MSNRRRNISAFFRAERLPRNLAEGYAYDHSDIVRYSDVKEDLLKSRKVLPTMRTSLICACLMARHLSVLRRLW